MKKILTYILGILVAAIALSNCSSSLTFARFADLSLKRTNQNKQVIQVFEKGDQNNNSVCILLFSSKKSVLTRDRVMRYSESVMTVTDSFFRN